MFIKSMHVYFFPDKSYKINKLKFEKKKQSIKSKWRLGNIIQNYNKKWITKSTKMYTTHTTNTYFKWEKDEH
jgi:hypothetical protein